MSHITKIEGVAIKSMSALRSAVQCLKDQGINCDLVEESKARSYYSYDGGDMDFVLRLHDAKHDVGFQKQQDGSLTPAMDIYGGHIHRVLGTGKQGSEQSAIGKLLREYAKELTIQTAAEQGQMVESCELDEVGNYQIVLQV